MAGCRETTDRCDVGGRVGLCDRMEIRLVDGKEPYCLVPQHKPFPSVRVDRYMQDKAR